MRGGDHDYAENENEREATSDYIEEVPSHLTPEEEQAIHQTQVALLTRLPSLNEKASQEDFFGILDDTFEGAVEIP